MNNSLLLIISLDSSDENADQFEININLLGNNNTHNDHDKFNMHNQLQMNLVFYGKQPIIILKII